MQDIEDRASLPLLLQIYSELAGLQRSNHTVLSYIDLMNLLRNVLSRQAAVQQEILHNDLQYYSYLMINCVLSPLYNVPNLFELKQEVISCGPVGFVQCIIAELKMRNVPHANLEGQLATFQLSSEGAHIGRYFPHNPSVQSDVQIHHSYPAHNRRTSVGNFNDAVNHIPPQMHLPRPLFTVGSMPPENYARNDTNPAHTATYQSPDPYHNPQFAPPMTFNPNYPMTYNPPFDFQRPRQHPAAVAASPTNTTAPYFHYNHNINPNRTSIPIAPSLPPTLLHPYHHQQQYTNHNQSPPSPFKQQSSRPYHPPHPPPHHHHLVPSPVTSVAAASHRIGSDSGVNSPSFVSSSSLPSSPSFPFAATKNNTNNNNFTAAVATTASNPKNAVLSPSLSVLPVSPSRSIHTRSSSSTTIPTTLTTSHSSHSLSSPPLTFGGRTAGGEGEGEDASFSTSIEKQECIIHLLGNLRRFGMDLLFPQLLHDQILGILFVTFRAFQYPIIHREFIEMIMIVKQQQEQQEDEKDITAAISNSNNTSCCHPELASISRTKIRGVLAILKQAEIVIKSGIVGQAVQLSLDKKITSFMILRERHDKFLHDYIVDNFMNIPNQLQDELSWPQQCQQQQGQGQEEQDPRVIKMTMFLQHFEVIANQKYHELYPNGHEYSPCSSTSTSTRSSVSSTAGATCSGSSSAALVTIHPVAAVAAIIDEVDVVNG